MESVLIDFVVLGVLFFPILLVAGIISKNDPKNNWNEEDLQYNLSKERELTPDFDREADKKEREK